VQARASERESPVCGSWQPLRRDSSPPHTHPLPPDLHHL
jgi:hypothetical protein